MSRRAPEGRVPRPRRPTTLLERPWPWIVLAGLVGGAVVAGGITLLRAAQDSDGDAGKAFFAVAAVGFVALVLMLVAGSYSLRKRGRALQERMPGTMMAWLGAHVWVGLAATFAIAVHVWLYPINSRITTGKITAAILVVLVLSGIAWRIVYRAVPGRVARSVGNLSVKDTRSRLAQIQVEIDKALAGASDDLRDLADRRLAGETAPSELDRLAESLALEDQARWQELKSLADRRDRYAGREPRQERYHRILQGWKILHLPLAVLMGAAIAIHVLDVLGVTKGVFADEADAFPDSAQCAGCHSEIVREWKLAIHSAAQLTPTTVAQTELALEMDPDIGQVCTNCHSPLGVQLAPSTTYPLPGEGDGLAILSEGVTCWTCHALGDEPTEIRGAEPGFPVDRAGSRSFGNVYNPALEGPPPLPVGDHQVEIGFFTSELDTYQLCGACHNVKVDLDGSGFSPLGDQASEGSGRDGDGDGVLDENELQEVDEDGDGIADLDVDGTGKIVDLVLQTTFDEWEDYVASGRSETCGTCHMPSLGSAPTVDDAPGNLELPERPRHSHEFVGVDYDLTPGHYSGLGVGGGDAIAEVLAARDALLFQTVSLDAAIVVAKRKQVRMEVTVRSGFIGHDFPTGFAFARQWWLEVSAATVDGEPVCLMAVNPGTGKADRRNGIATPCASGAPVGGGEWNDGHAGEDLRTCDPREVAAEFGRRMEARGLAPKNATVILTASEPLSDCDPWLANFQKILTDGDPEGTGTFVEVAYQSLLPDIVKLHTRVADQQVMGPLKPYDDPTTEVDERERTFAYVFDAGQVRGQEVVVTVRFNLRHLPPYFVRALDDYYPNGLTAESLLQQMVVSTFAVAETEPVLVPGG